MKHIVVNCERNDTVDIRCGGPLFLGYDFYVNDEDLDSIVEDIQKQLKKNHQPCMNIYWVDIPEEKVEKYKLWNKDSIRECIKVGY